MPVIRLTINDADGAVVNDELVVDGVLVLDNGGLPAGVSLASDGLLAGGGEIQGNVVANSAAVTPTGTLRVDGNLSIGSVASSIDHA